MIQRPTLCPRPKKTSLPPAIRASLDIVENCIPSAPHTQVLNFFAFVSGCQRKKYLQDLFCSLTHFRANARPLKQAEPDNTVPLSCKELPAHSSKQSQTTPFHSHAKSCPYLGPPEYWAEARSQRAETVGFLSAGQDEHLQVTGGKTGWSSEAFSPKHRRVAKKATTMEAIQDDPEADSLPPAKKNKPSTGNTRQP